MTQLQIRSLQPSEYLQYFFPKQSEAKVKVGAFSGQQIKKILECKEFPKRLPRKKKPAWDSFVTMVWSFLDNYKAENYVEPVKTLMKNYDKMGCRMSLKVNILDAYLDKFKENMGAYLESKASTSTRIYWTLNAATKERIMRKW